MCSTRRSPSVAHSRRLECFARTKRSTGSQFGTSWPPTPWSRAITWKHLRFLSFDPIRGAGSELTKFDLDSTPTSLDWEISPDGTQLAIFLADLGRIYVRSSAMGVLASFRSKAGVPSAACIGPETARGVSRRLMREHRGCSACGLAGQCYYLMEKERKHRNVGATLARRPTPRNTTGEPKR